LVRKKRLLFLFLKFGITIFGTQLLPEGTKQEKNRQGMRKGRGGVKVTRKDLKKGGGAGEGSVVHISWLTAGVQFIVVSWAGWCR
jgi:hypothetical protein